MNWTTQDLEVFEKEKEFIDTVLVPVIGIQFGQQMKQTANENEFTSLLAFHLERQFKGRMLVTPPYTYFQTAEIEREVDRLLKWKQDIVEFGVKHVFFLTSHNVWKKQEDLLDDSLLWVPSIPLEHLDETYKHSIMEDQVKKILNILVQNWQKFS